MQTNVFQEANVDQGNWHEFCWVHRGWCTMVSWQHWHQASW